MNKVDLTKKIAKKLNLTHQEAKDAVEVFLDTIKETLERQEDIELRDYFCLRFKEHESHQGRNFNTGESVLIPGGKKVHFIPSKNLKIGNRS